MTDTFCDLAKDAFSFLEDAGFRVVTFSESNLRYERASAFVSVGWDRRSGELEIFLGLRSAKRQPEHSFSLTDLLRMQDNQAGRRIDPPLVLQVGDLKPFLDKLAEELRTYAQPALCGDRMFFRRLDVFRTAQSEKLMDDMTMQRVRMEVEGAWRARQYNDVIRILGPVEELLTASEKAKLVYARKHRDD